MSNIQIIQGKIKSIRNIQKLAKAMELISTSKMYKARRLMLISKPYSEIIRKVIGHIALGKLEYKHTYCTVRNIQSVGYWVISSDRGLAGGLNINLFRILLNDIYKWNKLGVTVKLSIIGSKASSFFNYIDRNIIYSCISGLGDFPKLSELIGSITVMLKLYCNHEVDRLYIVYNRFISTLSHIPQILQILPILPLGQDISEIKHWDYLYEPDAQTLLDLLLNRYVESQVYQGVVENLASEQSSRMIAMKTASDNGETLIKDLKLFYNKIRQAKITQELTEIVAGASVI